MIGLRPGLSIWIATQPVDFRRGMDSLAMLVSEAFGADPFDGGLYIFRSKRRDRVKILQEKPDHHKVIRAGPDHSVTDPGDKPAGRVCLRICGAGDGAHGGVQGGAALGNLHLRGNSG
jgi:transposase